jgi:amidase
VSEGWPDGVDPVGAAASFGFHINLYFAALGEPTGLTLADAVAEDQRRTTARHAWQRCLTDDADVFLCPTTFTAAIRHDDRPFAERTIDTARGPVPYSNLQFWISHASLTGLPAVSAPIGPARAEPPAGMQIVGPLYEDDTAITFAELAADVIGGYRPPDLRR